MFDVHTMGSFAVLVVEAGFNWVPALNSEAVTLAVWFAGTASVGALIGHLRSTLVRAENGRDPRGGRRLRAVMPRPSVVAHAGR